MTVDELLAEGCVFHNGKVYAIIELATDSSLKKEIIFAPDGTASVAAHVVTLPDGHEYRLCKIAT